jgi:hypothetical protein
VTSEGTDTLNRTLKLEIDSGRAQSREEAAEIVRSYRLQIDIGPSMNASRARQAALLTAINTARRAFIGGVSVRVHDNPVLTTPWAQGKRLRDAVIALGGTIVDALDEQTITIVIGDTPKPPSETVLLHPTFHGWSGGVVRRRADRLPEIADFPLAGVLAGGLAVSEAFQAVRGDVIAARRDVGLSLWRPDVDWRATEAVGGLSSILPQRFWLLGLGHLGQASAWAIGMLPFAAPGEVLVLVQDVDRVVKANEATGLLVPAAWTQELKTRLVSRRLEALGFQTLISERLFGERTPRQPDEPGLAIAGFDRPEPRRALDAAGFDYAVDLGLGGGPDHYLDIVMHSFPSGLSSATAFTGRAAQPDEELLDRPAYRKWFSDLMAGGPASAEQIRCGLLEIAGRTAGAAFVGAVAASLGIAEAIRCLAEGPRYEVVDLSLRSPQYVEAAPNTKPGPPRNPGYTRASP